MISVWTLYMLVVSINFLILIGIIGLSILTIIISLILYKHIRHAKDKVCKDGHEWVTRDIKTAVSNHRCISHNYRIVFCKKCGLKKTSKEFR